MNLKNYALSSLILPSLNKLKSFYIPIDLKTLNLTEKTCVVIKQNELKR